MTRRGTRWKGAQVRTIDQAIAWLEAQAAAGTGGWFDHCQRMAREAYGIPGWADTARQAWGKTPVKFRQSGPLASVPRGAFIYYDLGGPGHVTVATRSECFSTDYAARDRIGRAPRDLPNWHAGGKVLGWSTWTPYGHTH